MSKLLTNIARRIGFKCIHANSAIRIGILLTIGLCLSISSVSQESTDSGFISRQNQVSADMDLVSRGCETPGQLVVTLKDALTGALLPGAIVTATRSSSVLSPDTESGGIYIFNDLQDSEYLVRSQISGYEQYWDLHTVPCGEFGTLNIDANVTQFPGLNTIEVKTFVSGTSTVISSTQGEVFLNGVSTVGQFRLNGDQSSFVVHGLADGIYTVTADVPFYTVTPQVIQVPASSALTTRDFQIINLNATDNCGIVGAIVGVASLSGSPIQNVLVILTDNTDPSNPVVFKVTTNAQGEYAISNVCNGTYDLAAFFWTGTVWKTFKEIGIAIGSTAVLRSFSLLDLAPGDNTELPLIEAIYSTFRGQTLSQNASKVFFPSWFHILNGTFRVIEGPNYSVVTNTTVVPNIDYSGTISIKCVAVNTFGQSPVLPYVTDVLPNSRDTVYMDITNGSTMPQGANGTINKPFNSIAESIQYLNPSGTIVIEPIEVPHADLGQFGALNTPLTLNKTNTAGVVRLGI